MAVSKGKIRPLGWAGSLLFFGIPTLLMLANFHLGIPALEGLGLSPFEAFIVASTVPMAILFAAALAALVAEQAIADGSKLREALRIRMRFPRLSLKAIFLGVGVYAAMVVAGGVAGVVGRALVEAQLIPLPDSVPLLLDPRAAINAATLTKFAGGRLAGNWAIIVLFAVQIFFNVAGEELWWRGYVLPRQELVFGRRTWLVHGLLWWGFHAFKWWDLVTVLPLALILSYAAQRSRNNWVPTMAHLLANSLLALLMLAGVLGLM
ncbi:MAG: CPBP family intramembrane glutamic endopeptidase [Candidatus Promineifilaceae bacterium]|nr:CPBP family intramembrane glutamic endopeptidase [Candidatus Promineifilaceae bacterium]